MLRGERFPGTNFKKPISGQVVRRLAEREAKAKEETTMKAARARDKRCRFPLCGCHRLKLRIDVAHKQHRGMGGNPKGDRTTLRGLITLCGARHRENLISLDRGNLKIVPLTRRGWDGPCMWLVDKRKLDFPVPTETVWVEVGVEASIGVFEAFTEAQTAILTKLREMRL